MDVIAHGGAGSPIDDAESRQKTLDTAVQTGLAADSALTAVCKTIRVLERDPAFNAGRGSAVQSDGRIRTDAGLMTADRRCGAVAGLTGVEHPIDVARGVLEETPHVMVAGEPATEFAATIGVETDADCWSQRNRERFEEISPAGLSMTAQLEWMQDNFGGHDTVGAVASDGEAVVAGTSTGGRWAALAGRVGDVPQVGAGFYASEVGGASATGAGEDIAREGLARQAVGLLEDGLSPATAASRAIERFDDRVEGTAGVIVQDAQSNAGSAFNSAAMQTATGSR